MLAANFACTLAALRLGGTGKTAVLVYTMPFWVLVFACWRCASGSTAGRGSQCDRSGGTGGVGRTLDAFRRNACQRARARRRHVLGRKRGVREKPAEENQRFDADDYAVADDHRLVAAGLGWGWLEAEPIRWTVGFGLALGYTAVLATGVAWMLSTMRSGACRREWSPWARSPRR